jgi:hypothetical protein
MIEGVGFEDHEARAIDFGRTAADYEQHRPGFPDSFSYIVDVPFSHDGWRPDAHLWRSWVISWSRTGREIRHRTRRDACPRVSRRALGTAPSIHRQRIQSLNTNSRDVSQNRFDKQRILTSSCARTTKHFWRRSFRPKTG